MRRNNQDYSITEEKYEIIKKHIEKIDKIKNDLQKHINFEIPEYIIHDIVENEDSIEVYVEPDDFYNVKDIFNKNDFEIFDAEIKLIANEKINELEEKIKTKLQEFIDSCDDDEDIQWVVTNYEEI